MIEAAAHLAWIREATASIEARLGERPEVAIIMGTGLGALAADIDVDVEIPYAEIPHFQRSTVETHSGRLLAGRLAGRRVVAMQGRLHLYEGYSAAQVVFPVRVMAALGARTLVVSNACGGMNPLWATGDVMLIVDHINLLGENPLVGPNLDPIGPRFPDMSAAYDPELRRLAEEVALEARIPLRRGVYVAVQGPNLETRAEYRMLRALGADVVGMSTVPEVIAAVHAGMRVLGLSIITDACLPDALQPTTLEEIVATARAAEPKLGEIVKGVLGRLGREVRIQDSEVRIVESYSDF
ncbi:MAG TPA: purine-nucleoside phosphorylase [Longimicrobiaceae bacterium]